MTPDTPTPDPRFTGWNDRLEAEAARLGAPMDQARQFRGMCLTDGEDPQFHALIGYCFDHEISLDSVFAGRGAPIARKA